MIGSQTKFIAFDTETTGLSPAANRVVEIAAIKFDLAGNEIGRFVELVNPGVVIPDEVIKIHRITNEMVAEAPLMGEVLPRFIEFFARDETVLIAQNAIFDIGFVNHEAIRSAITLPRNTILDQIDLTRHVFPTLNTYSLESVCRMFKLVDTQTHRAMSDAVLVMKLFQHCLKQCPTVEQQIQLLNSLYHYTFGGPMIAPVPEAILETVTSAMETGSALEICYSSGSLRGKPRGIIPTLMYNRDGVMYLNAKCLLANATKVFRVDRITECRILTDTNNG